MRLLAFLLPDADQSNRPNNFVFARRVQASQIARMPPEEVPPEAAL
jgi:hypothetical protein